jgi:hypothetical protein
MKSRFFAAARAAPWQRLVLAGAFLLLLLWQMLSHLPLTTQGMPYEGWDEVATYNTARVLSGPSAASVYRYGTLDTAIQVVANQYYLLFDPTGPQYRHYSYANNDYGSLNDEFYYYDQVKPGEMGFNYFRGIDDHRPIFISRTLHFGVFYALLAAAGLLWIAALGDEAIWLMLPMLCLTVNREVFEQTAQALPGGINTILSFAIVALVALAVEIERDRFLVLAAVGLALALNFKVDTAPLVVISGLGLVWRAARLGPGAGSRLGLAVAGAFVVTLVAAKPDLLCAPEQLRDWLWPPIAGTDRSLLATLGHNSLALLRDLKADMLPDAWLITVPTLVLPAVLLAGAAAVAVLLRRESVLPRLIVPALAVILLWLVPVAVATQYFGRYELNGLGAFYALLGMALLGLRRHGGLAGRRLAVAAAVLLVGQYGLLASQGAASAAYLAAQNSLVVWGEGNSGYSVGHSRTMIEWRAVNTLLDGGYDRTILVDQHAYLDLRVLRLAGLVPVYVNMDTLDTVLARLDRSIPHLLLYSPASWDTDPAWWQPWMSVWPADLDRRYDAYLAELSAFPVLDQIGEKTQHLFWAGPVDFRDRMILAAVPALASAGRTAVEEEVAKPGQSR